MQQARKVLENAHAAGDVQVTVVPIQDIPALLV